MIKLLLWIPRSIFKTSYLVPFLFSGLLISCSQDPMGVEETELSALQTEEAKGNKNLPATINFSQPALYPEGVAYDARHDRFLVTSLRFGTIGQVSPSGDYSPFITDERLISTIGIKIDEARQRVLVAVSDPGAGVNTAPTTAGKLAALGIYDLRSGALINFVDLSALRPEGGHFANDITLDPQGNAYVTDSFSPIIYKVDRDGNASVFFEDPAFATAPGQFGFNGITYHPSGYLLVAFSAANQIIRIPVREPEAYEVVQLNAPLANPDGLLLSKDGKQLIVVNNANGEASARVLSFTSNNKWETGTLTASFNTGAVFPTTTTAFKGEIFVLYAYLNKLFGGVMPPQSEFTIQKLPFTKNRPF